MTSWLHATPEAGETQEGRQIARAPLVPGGWGGRLHRKSYVWGLDILRGRCRLCAGSELRDLWFAIRETVPVIADWSGLGVVWTCLGVWVARVGASCPHSLTSSPDSTGEEGRVCVREVNLGYAGERASSTG